MNQNYRDMKKLFILFAVCFFTFSVSNAQRGNRGGDDVYSDRDDRYHQRDDFRRGNDRRDYRRRDRQRDYRQYSRDRRRGNYYRQARRGRGACAPVYRYRQPVRSFCNSVVPYPIVYRPYRRCNPYIW